MAVLSHLAGHPAAGDLVFGKEACCWPKFSQRRLLSSCESPEPGGKSCLVTWKEGCLAMC